MKTSYQESQFPIKTDIAQPSCPMSPSCEAITLVEKLVADPSFQGLFLTDKLLDLRSSFSLMRQDPKKALIAFYEFQAVLQKKNYLAYYKLRKLIAKHIELSISLEGERVHKLPVDLRWPSLSRFENYQKRNFFEHSEELIDWDHITLSYVCELS